MSQVISPFHETVIADIVRSLENKLCLNSSLALVNDSKSLFDAKIRGDVSIEAYLKRIVEYTQIEAYTIKYAIKLLERYCEKKSCLLQRKNCFKLLFTCILVSLKLNEDYIFTDKDMASIGGLKLKMLIELEAELLDGLDYKVAF